MSDTTSDLNVTCTLEEKKHPEIPEKTSEDVNYTSCKKAQALLDHEKPIKDELSFELWEMFYLIEKSNNDFWHAIRVKNNQKGLIPGAFFRILEEIEENSLEKFDWFFNDMNIYSADQHLFFFGVPGTFLIRRSGKKANSFALSVFDDNEQVLHFRINLYENNCYGFTSSSTFSTLESLLEYCKSGKEPSIPYLHEPLQKDFCLPTILGKYGWEVSQEDIEIIKKFDEDNFRQIYLANYKDKKNVTVKTIKHEGMKIKEFLNEAQMIKNLLHKHLVRLFGVCSQGSTQMIIFEHMEKGCLPLFLKDNENQISPIILARACTQICSAMKYLELKNIIHRDLKARSIWISKNNTFKVANFEMAKFCDGFGIVCEIQELCLVKWAAPETINERFFSIKSDVWSFGVLMWEIYSFCTSFPYKTMKNIPTLKYVVGGGILDKPEACCLEMYNIMTMCFTFDFNKRPKFSDIFPLLKDLSTN